MRYRSTVENAFNESMAAEREQRKQLDWALEWLAYYKAQADGTYADTSAKPTTVEELRKQSKRGGAPE